MRFLLFIALTLPVLVFSQVTESFDDGNFTANPVWSGDVSLYEVTNPPITGDGSLASANDGQVLRSLPSAGDAVLVTANTYAYGEWRFSIADGYNWSVSSTNDFKIILLSDNNVVANLVSGSQNFNGYYLHFDGGASDQFVLYRQSGTVSTPVISTGYPAEVDGTSSVGRSVRIVRSETGVWSVFIDEEFGVEATTQRGTSATDNTHTTSSWFGIVTNIANPGAARLVYFDNLYIGPEVEDTVKPELDFLTVVSANQLDVHFTESVEEISAETLTNYFVDNSIGNPTAASLDGTDLSLVHLTFASDFALGVSNIISIQNIADLNSNIIDPVNENFMYFIISPYDVIINEIMADPTPPLGLPEFEFIEIYNTSPVEINLANWMLTVGATTKTLSPATIPAGGYIILCHTDAQSELSDFGTVLPVPSFPALTNAGATIKLEDNNAQLIDQVSYLISWYGDGTKDDGGYTLERIDPENVCSGISNWNASTNITGGTPGSQNSIFGSNVDNTGPSVLNVNVVSENELRVAFNEPVVLSDALTIANYVVTGGFGSPYLIMPYDEENKVYSLYFTSSFAIGSNYTLEISGIHDDCSNIMSASSQGFQYYLPGNYDVVICEVMADPDPVVSLPGLEYLEIANVTGFEINMLGWSLVAGSYSDLLPDIKILPGEHIILVDANDTALLSGYGKVAGVSGMSELTNTGMKLTLMDGDGKIIHYLEYSDLWYGDSFKKDGGWSLEMVDITNPCQGAGNWKPSANSNGGTPGTSNSVAASNPDDILPEINRVAVYDENTIVVYFSEPMDSIGFGESTEYLLNGSSSNITQITLVSPDYQSVQVDLSVLVNTGETFTLEIKDTLVDCVGNELIDSEQYTFSWPQDPGASDLVINEVLFDPIGDGSDFVEIYNRSDKVFDLRDLRLATRDGEGVLESVKIITEEGFLFKPGEFMVITDNIENILANYYSSNTRGFVQVESLPSFSNESGEVVLMDKTGEVIDDFIYTDEMHFALLASFDGVSLERIHYDRSTADNTNWHSASETVGFATPAYKNSQYSEEEPGSDEVSLSLEIFSPDNDGYEDVLEIFYQFDEPGYLATVKIFDAKGRLVKDIANEELLGTSGSYLWHGLDRFDEKARIGAYILYFEVFDLKGNTKKYKRPVIVASKLN